NRRPGESPGRPRSRGRRTGLARRVHAAARRDVVRKQPLAAAQPHRLRGPRGAREAAALCALMAATGVGPRMTIRHWEFVIPLLLGPIVLVGWLFLVDVGLSPEAHRLAGILLFTLIWWVAEPIPIAATGLLGVALCVILGAVPPAERGRDGLRLVFAPFADPSVFFLMGGMFIGRAMTRHG